MFSFWCLFFLSSQLYISPGMWNMESWSWPQVYMAPITRTVTPHGAWRVETPVYISPLKFLSGSVVWLGVVVDSLEGTTAPSTYYQVTLGINAHGCANQPLVILQKPSHGNIDVACAVSPGSGRCLCMAPQSRPCEGRLLTALAPRARGSKSEFFAQLSRHHFWVVLTPIPRPPWRLGFQHPLAGPRVQPPRLPFPIPCEPTRTLLHSVPSLLDTSRGATRPWRCLLS